MNKARWEIWNGATVAKSRAVRRGRRPEPILEQGVRCLPTSYLARFGYDEPPFIHELTPPQVNLSLQRT